MHNKKEALETRLLKILKNEYPKIHNLCKKLEENDNDISILSSTELNELWSTIKHLLNEVQNLSKLQAKSTETTFQEHNTCSITYNSIVKIALQTLKFDDIPEVLQDILILLHSALPEINEQEVKDNISILLEECWKLNFSSRENTIINALGYLTECAKKSLQHVKRLNDVKCAIPLLKSFKDIKNVMKLVRERTLLAVVEGRELLIYLFTLGDDWIMGVYNNIRVSLQTADNICIKAYSDILTNAWQSRTENRETVEECLKNLIFHCLRAQRNINGRGKLGKNLLTLLQFFHSQTNNAVKQMICDQYLELLWTCLEAPGCHVRCNAADVLFLAYPMIVSNETLKTDSSLRNKSYLRKQHSAITSLLKDSSEKVCIIAFKGMFHILEKFWVSIPSIIINEWLNIALEHTRSSSCPEIRKSVFQGLKRLLNNPQSERKLKDILPHFADSIYDTNVEVQEEVLELFLQINNRSKIQIWDIVPLTCIIEGLDVTPHKEVVDLFHKFLWTKFSSTTNVDNAVLEIIDTGQLNINVLRKFFLHSKGIISKDNALKLINSILSAITPEVELLSKREISEDSRVKRHKPSEQNETDSHERSNHLPMKHSLNELSTIQILIDTSALLYAVNSEEFLKYGFKDEIKELNSKIAEEMRHILEKIEDEQINETAIFFLSLIPEKIVENCEELFEECMRTLFDSSISDGTILSILNLLIKWNKLESVLKLLLSLLKIDTNLQHNLTPVVEFETTNNKSETDRQIRMFNLGVRILQLLLQSEFHSFFLNEYHENMIQFWKDLSFCKTLVEKSYTNNSFVLPEDVLKILFKQYVSLIPILHHSDKFRASRHFSMILTWTQEEVVLRASGINDFETDEFSISILKCVFETSNTMIVQFKANPKLCCEIIILYCKVLIAKCGITFVNDALVTVLRLMQFSTDIYSNRETELIKVVPSLFAAVMVTLTKYPVELLKKYTNNLKLLEDFMNKLFPIMNHPLNRDLLRLGYLTIIFNTAVFCVSKNLLNSKQIISVDLFHREFPFISEEIINIILRGKGFQDLCIEVFKKAILKYNSIDLLSSLLIIQRLAKSKNKTSAKKRMKRIKDIVSSAKGQSQQFNGEDSPTSVYERLVIDAKNKVFEEILNS